MESQACTDELTNDRCKNHISISKEPDEICGDIVEGAKNVALSSQSPKTEDSQRPSIGPITPDSSRENGEQDHFLLSPLTVFSSPPQAPCPSDGNGQETPKEALYNAFAPGPDKFMLAPRHSKYREHSRNHVVRRLDFACEMNLVEEFSQESDIEMFSEQEHLFEIIYGTILDAIISENTKELQLVVKLPTEDLDFEGHKTPKSAWIVSGVAETCPGAPMKSASKYRSIDKEICRKLEF